MREIHGIDDALSCAGEVLGTSSWTEIKQDRIDQFADVTDDHQWIHVDTDRAATESPYGATIAHGFLTLSLIPSLARENYRVLGHKMGINYGLNKVRFLAAVTPGSRIRLTSEMVNVDKVGDNTVNLTIRHTVEIEDNPKPAMVADLISRFVF